MKQLSASESGSGNGGKVAFLLSKQPLYLLSVQWEAHTRLSIHTTIGHLKYNEIYTLGILIGL